MGERGMTAYHAIPVDAPLRPDVMDQALRLLTALSDPKQAKINLEKHAANAKKEPELDEREAAIERREAIVAAKLESLDEDVAKQRSEAERRMSDDRVAFDADIAGRLKDLEKREAAVQQADEKYLALNADLERRLTAIKKAAS
jgi:hypothetical protein